MVESASQQVPVWRREPKPALIKISMIGKDWSGQILAEFVAGGQTYVVSVDESLIDRAKERMKALIIADVGDNYLVDLPGESLSAGSRVLIGAEELEEVKAGDMA